MTQEKKASLWERGANFFEKLHLGIGAAALAGYVLFQKEILAVVGVYELAHGLVINGLKNWIKKYPKDKASPKLAVAH